MLVVFVCNALILLMSLRPNRATGEFKKSREDPCCAHHKKSSPKGEFFLWCFGTAFTQNKCFVAFCRILPYIDNERQVLQ